MALRGKKPTAEEKRLKMMLFGPAGVGKTTAAIQFPRPYLMDTEKGSVNDQYVDQLNRNGGAVFATTEFDEMVAEVVALLSTKHDYRTLIIDPITVVYNDLLDKAAKKVGTDFGRHYGEADKRMRHLLNLLLRLDMNVVITCHAKNVYGDGMKIEGQTFDGYKKLDYMFDLVIELQKRGKDRVGIPRKSRVSSMPEGEVFPFSYEAIAERYGRAVLERDATPVVLASAEQIGELTRMLTVLKLPEEVTDKWLDKAGADRWAEMSAEQIGKCIDYCKTKFEKGTATE